MDQRGTTRTTKTPTRSGPALCALLHLQQHVFAVIIIVEEMNVVQYQNEWSACSPRIAQRNLLQLIECCRVDECKPQR